MLRCYITVPRNCDGIAFCWKLAHISFKLNISVVCVATLFKSWFWYWNPYLSPFCTHCINPAVLCSCFQALTGLAILCDRQRTEPDSSALTTKKVPLHLSGSSIWVYPVCASINSICPLMSQLIFTSEHFESLWEMQDGKGMYSRKKNLMAWKSHSNSLDKTLESWGTPESCWLEVVIRKDQG